MGTLRLELSEEDARPVKRHLVPEKPDGDVPGRPKLVAKRPAIKQVAKALARLRAKQAKYTNGTHVKTPWRAVIPQRYIDYCDHVRDEAANFSRYKALLALLDLGIATYESMEERHPQ